jgi:hypothetical protein
MRTKPDYLDASRTIQVSGKERQLATIMPGVASLKKLLMILFVVTMSYSCMGIYVPIVDTSPPEIVSVYTSPETVVAGHPFTLIVQTYDYESLVTVTYDMDNDGMFDDGSSGIFPDAGSKTIAVRAESAGGVTVNFYILSVVSRVLDLFLTFSAVTNILNGDFEITYIIQNYGNVPILLTGNSYVIYDSNYTPIRTEDIGIVSNTLVYNTYLDVNESILQVLAGYSMYLIPYFFDIRIFYNDGYGNSSTEVYLGGVFVRQ